MLLANVKKAIGNSDYTWRNHYWSSSEYSDIPAYNAWYTVFSNGRMDWYVKYYNNYVRAWLAF
ncbi:MAG: DUF1566 domain-containing protein [Bacteroides sp.]|nr:DUF1566 domain-containing protein [Bacteroides sp.]